MRLLLSHRLSRLRSILLAVLYFATLIICWNISLLSTQSPSENQNKQSVSNRPSSRKNKRYRKADSKESPSWTIDQFQVPEQEGKLRFHDLDLEAPLMHGIADLGFQYCSPIQAQSLPNTLQGYDLLGKAQTGTGKTAAFLIAIIDDLLKKPH